jgi:hypothetical protein
MNIAKSLAIILIAVFVSGCQSGGDHGAEEAVKIVQEFKPAEANTPIVQMLKASFSREEWSVSKTSEDLYRVTFKGSAAGENKDLIFGVSIHKKSVMALNKDALAYTNPM